MKDRREKRAFGEATVDLCTFREDQERSAVEELFRALTLAKAQACAKAKRLGFRVGTLDVGSVCAEAQRERTCVNSPVVAHQIHKTLNPKPGKIHV